MNFETKMNDIYQDPLVSRYTDKEMQYLFSEEFKAKTWRECWIALAESEMQLGLETITPEMIEELKAAKETINFEVIKEKEKQIRHDVMAHVYEFGTHCPNAKRIIHLGATSQFVVCNTDLIKMKEGLKIIKSQLISTIKNLSDFANDTKNVVTLAYTHFQSAQPTTIGKRMTLYLHDLIIDLKELEYVSKLIKARGAKGTTGTQASYFELFDGDFNKVKELDKLVSQKLGFETSYSVTGQTYSRKIDSIIIKMLANIAETATKFAIDLRLASNLKIMEEPFEKNQTGSSAMAYKRNPMRSERMTSLSRKLIGLQINASHTYANQWFERTLDDSAIRRMDLPQAFLLSNAILKLFENITSGMVIYPAQIKKHLNQELPFMATEAILMELVKKGMDRQGMHELIKIHSIAAGKVVKEEGKPNDLFERIANDPKIPLTAIELDIYLTNPDEFAGFASSQTEEFLRNIVAPILEKNKEDLETTNKEINV